MVSRNEHPLLVDATAPTNFCKAGIQLAERFATHIGDHAFVVHDVYEELVRNPKRIPALDQFLRTWPPSDPILLANEVRAKVADALSFNQRYGEHRDRDRGEHATVFHAQHILESQGDEFVILTDDGDGKTLARRAGLEVIDTPEIIVRMVIEGSLSEQEGLIVWKKTLPNRDKAYWDRLSALRVG